MNSETIGTLVEKTRQVDPVKLGREFITYIDIASIDRQTKRIVQPQIVHAAEAPSRARKQIQTDDVLVATVRPNLNAVARVTAAYNNEIASTGFCILRPDKNLFDSGYLFFFVQTNNFVSRLTRLAIGAGYPAVSDDDILDCEIPFPPLPEQRRIAARLDKADHLRRTRRYAAQLRDTFLQAVFVRMFGDPVQNPKGWKINPLRDVATKFSDGPFGSDLKTEHYVDSGVRVIRLQNVGVGELIGEDKAFISQRHFEELAKHRCEPGDVIVATLGDPNLRACILPLSIPVALNKADCTQIRVDRNVAYAEYVCWLLNLPSTLHLAAGMILGETRARISMGRLAELLVPIPPLALQREFARIVQQFERLRAQQREAERQAEHLFQTLLHGAFA